VEELEADEADDVVDGLHLPLSAVPNPQYGEEEEITELLVDDGLHLPSRAVPNPQ